MTEPILKVGQSELDDKTDDVTSLRNSVTETEIQLLEAYIEIIGAGFGNDSNRVPSSFFEELDAATVDTTTLTATDADTTTLTTTDAETSSLVYNDANEDPQTIDPATGTVDIDLSVSNWWQPIQVTENITLTFSNLSTDPSGNSVILFFEDGDDLGPYDVTFPEGTRWPGGNARNTIPEGGNTRITLTTFDGGTTWDALRSGENFEEPV